MLFLFCVVFLCFVLQGALIIMRTNKTIGFADLAAARRIKKEDFLTHINKIIDWRPVGNIINKNYQKGKSHTGRPAYDGLLLFKICLLQNWYNLSDYEAEERINK